MGNLKFELKGNMLVVSGRACAYCVLARWMNLLANVLLVAHAVRAHTCARG